MPPSVSRFLSPALALLLAGGLYAQMRSYRVADSDETSRFHAAVREAVEQIPIQVGEFDSIERQVPPAAGKLLRPNAIFCRRYIEPTGRWATVILIHCQDARDMSGHYPPNCYRGSGWTQAGPPVIRNYPLWGTQVPIAEYEFSRTELNRVVRWVIYDFFVLPAAGIVTSMEQVQDASGDYRTRPFGAAQIQVIFDASMPEAERRELLTTFLEPLRPVAERLQLKKEGAQ